jgi:pimeloyl-ACP methyl ester carboxylesterase
MKKVKMFRFQFSDLAAGAAIFFIAAHLSLFPHALMAQDSKKIKTALEAYPEGVTEIRYRSSGDNTEQPMFFWQPDSTEKRPLLVALHTWSSDYTQAGGEAKYAEWCQKAGWVFVHPNFRGPNRSPHAMGSDLAVADIISAIDHARGKAQIDESRIYCIGVSGGGHASLLMAGRAPDLWAGVSAWCGISDIAAWHEQCTDTKFSKYARDIEKSLGGAPDNDKRRADAVHRSPINWLPRAAKVNLDINHGIHDGRAGSVPFTHSLYAFDAVVNDAQAPAAIGTDGIKAFFKSQQSPDAALAKDPLYPADQQPVFRRTDGNCRVTIFEGGHEILHEAALNWLAAQQKGHAANWQPERVHQLDVKASEKESGK